jgi:hypothetical protein
MAFQARQAIEVAVEYEISWSVRGVFTCRGFTPLELEENPPFRDVWMQNFEILIPITQL